MIKSKKGFSLVELIVVIAIMAVLVGVLAPALMGQVEKSRKQKDESAVAELVHNVEIVLADEGVYDEIVTNGVSTLTFSISADGVGGKRGIVVNQLASTYPKLTDALKEQLKDFNLTSKAYKDETSYVVTVGGGSGSAIVVTGAWGSASTPAPANP